MEPLQRTGDLELELELESEKRVEVICLFSISMLPQCQER
jgi:hypothetical protein